MCILQSSSTELQSEDELWWMWYCYLVMALLLCDATCQWLVDITTRFMLVIFSAKQNNSWGRDCENCCVFVISVSHN
jgi:hypothetical protein